MGYQPSRWLDPGSVVFHLCRGLCAIGRNPARRRRLETLESQAGETNSAPSNMKYRRKQQIPWRSAPGPIDAFPARPQDERRAIVCQQSSLGQIPTIDGFIDAGVSSSTDSRGRHRCHSGVPALWIVFDRSATLRRGSGKSVAPVQRASLSCSLQPHGLRRALLPTFAFHFPFLFE
jgi:hypothetical protein